MENELNPRRRAAGDTVVDESFPTTEDRFGAYISAESTRFADVIRKAKLTLE